MKASCAGWALLQITSSPPNARSQWFDFFVDERTDPLELLGERRIDVEAGHRNPPRRRPRAGSGLLYSQLSAGRKAPGGSPPGHRSL